MKNETNRDQKVAKANNKSTTGHGSPGDGNPGDAQPTREEKPDIQPPSSGRLAGVGPNDQDEHDVVRNEGDLPGGASKPEGTTGRDRPGPDDDEPGGFDR